MFKEKRNRGFHFPQLVGTGCLVYFRIGNRSGRRLARIGELLQFLREVRCFRGV